MKYYENAMKSTSPRRQGSPKGNDSKITPPRRKKHAVGGEDVRGKPKRGPLPDRLTVAGLFQTAKGSSSSSTGLN